MNEHPKIAQGAYQGGYQAAPVRAELPPNPVVCIFEPDGGEESAAAAVQQLNYPTLRCEGLEGARALSGRSDVVAAIVSDATARPFELCACIPASIPKIVIASDSTFAFRLAASRVDVTGIIQRPIQQSELGDWLKLFVAERTVHSATVLIVDDDPVMADLHASVLRFAGMCVRVVDKPVDALAALEASPPDLILMDVQMPGVDGIQLAKIIRQARQHVAVPIAFLSAEQDVNRQLEARRFGGDIFIKKPVDPKNLISLVRLRAERSRALRSMIERDSLTGLYNHGEFKERLIQEFSRSRRSGSPLSFAMIDIDHFKSVNDRFGHPVGDRVIRGLAGLLTSRLRTTDIVGRYGGEEFGVLLLDTPPHAAANVIDGIRKIMGATTFDIGDQSLSVTFSAGIASASNIETHAELVAAADHYLYDAKHAGRNQVVVETSSISLAPSNPESDLT
jgi:diguanylate cyclase (GGDEF)-like protein